VVGTIHFWHRRVDRLETQVWRSELGQGRVSTKEQTLLDIGADPRKGGVSVGTAQEALRLLADAVDWNRVFLLAKEQRTWAAYRRVRWFANEIAPDAPMPPRSRSPVSSLGLK